MEIFIKGGHKNPPLPPRTKTSCFLEHQSFQNDNLENAFARSNKFLDSQTHDKSDGGRKKKVSLAYTSLRNGRVKRTKTLKGLQSEMREWE